MALHPPVLLQSASGDPSLIVTGQEYRNATTALLAANIALPVNSSWSYAGGLPDAGWSSAASNGYTGSMTVSQRGAGANFSVDVAAGWAFIIGNDVTNQGVYACWNDGTVNVVTPSAPGSGTRNHRLILQLQDKLENGTFTGYQAQFVLLQDTGSGTPSVSSGGTSSAITLAIITIASGQASVTNSNITDYRRNIGACLAYKTADQSKTTSTTLGDDNDLQLWGLQTGATYAVTGAVYYHGGTGGSEGDIKWTWRIPGSGSGQYAVPHARISDGNFVGAFTNLWTDTNNAQTGGTGIDMVLGINGTFSTGGTSPNNFLVFQWAKNSSPDSTATTVRAGSYLRAVRVA